MASVRYNSYKTDLLNAAINHVNDTIRVAMTTSTYTPDQDAHDFFDDVTNEVTGTGYTAGGEIIANPTVSQDDTDNEGVFDGDDTVWAASTIANARYAIIYKDTGDPATSPLICAIDFGSDLSSSGGDFTITWNSEGIVNISEC